MSYISDEEIRRIRQNVRDNEDRIRRENIARVQKKSLNYCITCHDLRVHRGETADKIDWRKTKNHEIGAIIEFVANHYCLPVWKLKAQTRKRDIVIARQVAIYFLREKTNLSLKQIGLLFGGRDHTTAIHSIKTVNDLLATDQLMRDDVDYIRRKL